MMASSLDVQNKVPKTPTMEAFWESVLTGEVHVPDKAAIEAIYKKDPMTPLSEAENEVLDRHLDRVVTNRFRDLSERAIGDFVYVPRDTDFSSADNLTRGKFHRSGDHFLVDASSFEEDGLDCVLDFLKSRGLGKLSLEDKIRVFSDPDIYASAVFVSSFETGKNASTWPQTNTPLSWYGFDDQFFMDKMEELRAGTGRDKMRVADLGGSVGRALYDAKNLDPNIETTNFTLEAEPAMWPVDHLELGQIERMDKRHFEKFDFVFSRYTFMHLVFQDIAFKNLLYMLDVGGEAIISLSTHNNYFIDQEELLRRFQELHIFIKPLIEAGILICDLAESQFEHGVVYLPHLVRVKKMGHISLEGASEVSAGVRGGIAAIDFF